METGRFETMQLWSDVEIQTKNHHDMIFRQEVDMILTKEQNIPNLFETPNFVCNLRQGNLDPTEQITEERATEI